MSGSVVNVQDIITNEYYSLTAAEKKIADHLLAHKSAVQDLTITELAEACEVAEATLSRFCRKLGFKGYNSFKLAMVSSFTPSDSLNPLGGEVTESDSFQDVCSKLFTADVNSMTQTMEFIRQEDYIRAADLLVAAGKVLCMGQGGSHLIAREAAHLFSTISGKYFAVEDNHLQAIAAANADEGDVILFFSYSGATRDMAETFHVAKGRGVKLVLVTHYPNAPTAAEADVVLQCGANESPMQLGSVAAKIAQLYLLDVLFSEVCLRDLPACRESRARIADALADKHL